MKNIVLIGFMGVGKGTLAREIVKQNNNLYGIDTDDLIESYTNKKIKKIFKDEGERYFRELEQKTADWLAKNVANAVISTGGGFYNVKHLHDIGVIVYLKADFNWIIDRIYNAPNAKKKIKKRPLLQEKKKAHALYKQRIEVYEKAADITIDVSRHSVRKNAEYILNSTLNSLS